MYIIVGCAWPKVIKVSPSPPKKTAGIPDLNSSAYTGNELISKSPKGTKDWLLCPKPKCRVVSDNGIQVNWAETKQELSMGICTYIYTYNTYVYGIGSSSMVKEY